MADPHVACKNAAVAKPASAPPAPKMVVVEEVLLEPPYDAAREDDAVFRAEDGG